MYEIQLTEEQAQRILACTEKGLEVTGAEGARVYVFLEQLLIQAKQKGNTDSEH